MVCPHLQAGPLVRLSIGDANFMSMIKMLRVASCAIVLVSVIGTAQNQPPITNRYGIVQGTVVDETGRPVANAIVYIYRTGRSPSTTTDKDGKFLLALEDAGIQRVFAYKESDGFPNPIWSFYSAVDRLNGFPIVNAKTGRSI